MHNSYCIYIYGGVWWLCHQRDKPMMGLSWEPSDMVPQSPTQSSTSLWMRLLCRVMCLDPFVRLLCRVIYLDPLWKIFFPTSAPSCTPTTYMIATVRARIVKDRHSLLNKADRYSIALHMAWAEPNLGYVYMSSSEIRMQKAIKRNGLLDNQLTVLRRLERRGATEVTAPVPDHSDWLATLATAARDACPISLGPSWLGSRPDSHEYSLFYSNQILTIGKSYEAITNHYKMYKKVDFFRPEIEEVQCILNWLKFGSNRSDER